MQSDIEQIQLSLHLIMHAPNETIRKQADQYFRDAEKNNPMLSLALLEIIENNQDFIIKQSALILLKNVIVRNWTKMQIKDQARVPNLSEEVKTQIKTKIIFFLGVVQDSKLKKEINQILQAICKHDFPNKFPLLTNYFIQGLATIQQSVTHDPNAAIGPYCIDLVVTLKGIIQEQSKRRMANFKHMQHEFILQIWQPLMFLWEAITKLQQQCSNDNERLLQICVMSKKIDRVLATAILSSHAENDLDTISQLCMNLLRKVAFLMQIAQNNRVVQSNLKTLIHSLTNVQQIFPLSLLGGLQDYLSMLQIVVATKWEDQRITKTGLIGIAKVLKTYFYYCNDEQFKSTVSNPKYPNYLQIKQQAEQIFNQFFKTEVANILECIIQLASCSLDLSEEEIIEQEEDNTIDDIKSELHCPLYTICLVTVEQLMTRFPQLAFQNLATFLEQIQRNNFQIGNMALLDSFFAILGQVPRVAIKFKMDMKSVIDILPVLQYLSTSKTQQNLRRCTILASRFIQTFHEYELMQVMQMVINLMTNTTDSIVKFQSLMCVKTIVSSVSIETEVQWHLILEKVAPIIVDLLSNFQKATTIWPLLSVLQRLIEKSKYQSVDVVLKALEQGNLGNLMMTKQELLVDALCDMIKTLMVSFPLGSAIPHVHKLALLLIESNIDTHKHSVLMLYLFVLQEYSEIQGVDQQLHQLFVKYQHNLLEDMELQNMETIIFILEEYLLLSLIPYQQIPAIVTIIEERYTIANQLETHDIGVQIKNACLSVLSTIILLMLNHQRIEDLGLLNNLVQMCFQDFMRTKPQQQPLHHNLLNGIQSISILNRYILQDTAQFVQFINTFQVTADAYFALWIANSNIVTSRSARKLNVLALLIFIKQISRECFLKYFEEVLKECYPEVNYYNDSQDPVVKQRFNQNQKYVFGHLNSRLGQFRTSERKEKLRQTQMYDEINIQQFFVENIKGVLQQFEITSMAQLQQCIQDQSVLDTLTRMVE